MPAPQLASSAAWHAGTLHPLHPLRHNTLRTQFAGMSLKSLAMVLKVMGNDDTVTLKADDDGDRLTLMFEAPDQVLLRLLCSACHFLLLTCLVWHPGFPFSVERSYHAELHSRVLGNLEPCNSQVHADCWQPATVLLHETNGQCYSWWSAVAWIPAPSACCHYCAFCYLVYSMPSF